MNTCIGCEHYDGVCVCPPGGVCHPKDNVSMEERGIGILQWPESNICVLDDTPNPDCYCCVYGGEDSCKCARGEYIQEHRKGYWNP